MEQQWYRPDQLHGNWLRGGRQHPQRCRVRNPELHHLGNGDDIVTNNPSALNVNYSDIGELVDGSVWPGTRNIRADPLFVDAPNLDSHLTPASPGSPCIDAGHRDDPAPPPGEGTIVDMGAFESTGNKPPTVVAGGPYNTDEGGSVEVTATGSDPDGDALTYAWDLDNYSSFETPGQSVTFSAEELEGPSARTISVQVTDSGGLTATDQTAVEVDNVAPAVGEIMASADPVQVDTIVEASAAFSDPGVLDTHAAEWEWGDVSTSAGTVEGSDGSGAVTGSHTYGAPGVYTVTLTVTDDDGDAGECVFQYVVVYNPDGGFVTGGGWITSPEGAYAADPLLTGKASFGFVAKYRHGADSPSGETEFQFRVAELNFHSTEYQWLVVAGAKAKYKGSGTINNDGEYGFMLTATDCAINGGGATDKCRSKIWHIDAGDEVVYDKKMGSSDDSEDATELGGGSMMIRKEDEWFGLPGLCA